MKISNDFPPNYKLIQLHFPSVEKHKPLFAWGDTIYNPFKVEITKDLEIHEEVHQKQQGNNPEEWWFKYLNDLQFRLSQEIQAYSIQYTWINKLDMKRSIKDWKRQKMAEALSGSLYGNMVSYQEAESKIRNFSKNNTTGTLKD